MSIRHNLNEIEKLLLELWGQGWGVCVGGGGRIGSEPWFRKVHGLRMLADTIYMSVCQT